MAVKDAINRTNNLVSTVVVSLAGFAFLPEAFIEDKVKYKIDDGLLFLLGLFAIWWYKKGDNKYKRSIYSVVIVIAALAIKIIGFIIEMKEKDDVGDDYGGLILFALATIVAIYLFKTSKRLLEAK